MRKNVLKKGADYIQVDVSVIVFEEHGIFVAYCPALELSSYGENEKEAKEAFEGAMDIFIKETSQRGTLEKFLLQLGWSLQKRPKIDYRPPTLSLKESQKLISKNGKVYDERVAMPV